MTLQDLKLLKFLLIILLPEIGIAQIAPENALKFQLINTKNDRVIAPLVEGNLIKLSLGHYNLKEFSVAAAQVPPGTQKIEMNCEGPVNQSKTENFAPFSLFGDDGESDFKGTSSKTGTYVFTAKSFSGNTVLDDFRARFIFTNALPGPMLLSLIDADKDVITGSFAEENIGLLNVRAWNIKTFSFALSQYPPETQSVRFVLDGPIRYEKLESTAPFSLFGDVLTNGDFYGADVLSGVYTLTVRTYDDVQGKGNIIRTMIYRFSLDR